MTLTAYSPGSANRTTTLSNARVIAIGDLVHVVDDNETDTVIETYREKPDWKLQYSGRFQIENDMLNYGNWNGS